MSGIRDGASTPAPVLIDPHSDEPPSLRGLPLVTFTPRIGSRTWQIAAVRDQDALLAAADRFAEFPFGLLLWESAPALANALVGGALGDLTGRSVLELGAGCGLAGLVAASLGAEVCQTDHIAEALALCRHNAEANAISGVDLALADWLRWTDTGTYDVILGADVVYDRAVFEPLLAIFDRNLTPDGRVLLADPCRLDTPAFLDLARQAGWVVDQQRTTELALMPSGRSEVDIDVIALQRANNT